MSDIKDIKPISLVYSFLLFLIPSIYFVLITYLLIPFINSHLEIHPALSWFIGASLVFIPIFILAIILAMKDGYITRKQIFERFRLKKLSSRDWRYVVISSIIILVSTGAIMGFSKFLNIKFGISELQTTPPFLKFEAFVGKERFLLIAWLFMFFFNMFGEEILWRGYILPRQEVKFKRYSWIINGVFWIIFHICFGLDLIIILLPIMFVLPYAVYKTKNTYVGVLIHAILNGPMFIMVSLGFIH
ncbi:MAG: CPBP family intramembrane metalloprotease [Marinilabiliales bacterium]|nr:MAG: CPBP family intramembrane metalloprotease [Marinilabiliales bacterium]